MKRKLLLATLCVVGALGFKTNAQAYSTEDLASAGWTQVTSITDVNQNFFLFVDADGRAAALGQATQSGRPVYKALANPFEDASLAWLLEGNENVYKLKNVQTGGYFNSGDAGWNDSMSATGTDFTFTLNNGAYDISCTTGYIGSWNESKSVSATLPEDAAANKQKTNESAINYAIGFYVYSISRADFITKRNAALAEASKTNPIDITSYILNNDFEAKNGNGWVHTGNAGNQQYGQGTMESWNNNNVSVTQTLSAIPNGLYRLSADMISGDANTKTGYVYAKGSKELNSENVSAVSSAAIYATMSTEVAGKTLTIDNILVTNNTLTVGFKDPSGWVVVDNFKLYYLGTIDLSEYQSNLASLRDEAKSILDANSPMLPSAKSNLQSAYDATATVEETQEALEAAISTISTPLASAKTSVEAYASAAKAIADAKALQTNNNFVTAEAATTFAEAIAAIETPYNEGTLSNEDAAVAGKTLGFVVVDWHGAATVTPAANYMRSAWPSNYVVNDWSVEGVTDGSNYLVPFFEDWTGDANSLGAKTTTGTVTGLANGLYQVSAWIRVRAKNGTAAADATGITLDVNGGTAVDVTEGTVVEGTQFQLKEYTAEGIVKNGELSVNFNIASDNNISWLSFKNVKYTKVRDLIYATEGDYAALNAAMEGKTLGFEKDEYAPYNNVAAAQALAAAQSIDQTALNTQEDVQAATNALKAANWTENTEEVNAVYNGKFALSENDGAMDGWQTSSSAGLGGAVHARAFVLTSGMTNYGNLSAFGQGDGTRSCAYMRFDGTNSGKDAVYTYGLTTGYTMPLRAKVYRLKAQLGGWGQVDKDITVKVVKSSGEEVAAKTVHTLSKGLNEGGSAIDLDFFLNIETAGDYKITINNSNTGVDNAIAISNIELYSAPETSATMTVKAGKWGTFIAPFEVTVPAENVEAYTVSDVDESGKLQLSETSLTTIPANTPVLLKNLSDDEQYSEEFSGQSIATEESYSTGTLTGVYAETTLAASDATATRYVLQTHGTAQAFYKVTSDDIKVSANRCYLTIAASVTAPARITFSFDDEATGINAVEGGNDADKDALYNLAGQRVGKDYKGIVVKNGKKVLMK